MDRLLAVKYTTATLARNASQGSTQDMLIKSYVKPHSNKANRNSGKVNTHHKKSCVK